MTEEENRASLERADRVLEVEITTLGRLRESLGEEFLEAARCVFECRGRLVVTGMGKSGIVAQKIAATLASTGSPALFLHPAEAAHGDLGMVCPGDVVLALSASGETEEILRLLPFLRVRGVPVLAVVRSRESSLAKHSQVILQIPFEEEGCPLGLAPMASSTAMIALGDALAAVLMEWRGFQREDFALFHPQGSLGRRLLTTVADLMVEAEDLPCVVPGTGLREVIHVMVSTNLGAVLVAAPDGSLEGILTDGDIKRILERHEDVFSIIIDEVMTREPITVAPDLLAEEALRLMERDPKRRITVLPVVAEDGTVQGLLRLHDVLAAKIGR